MANSENDTRDEKKKATGARRRRRASASGGPTDKKVKDAQATTANAEADTTSSTEGENESAKKKPARAKKSAGKAKSSGAKKDQGAKKDADAKKDQGDKQSESPKKGEEAKGKPTRRRTHSAKPKAAGAQPDAKGNKGDEPEETQPKRESKRGARRAKKDEKPAASDAKKADKAEESAASRKGDDGKADKKKQGKPARGGSRRRRGATSEGAVSEETRRAAREFDAASLKPKQRVHELAKRLGATSRELIVALNGLGITKVAQSTLVEEDARRLLEALAEPRDAAEAKEADEKLRERVEKNVANEINQIEQKVDRDLAAERDDEAEAGDEAEEPAETEVGEPAGDAAGEAAEPAPKPAGSSNRRRAPLFKAPEETADDEDSDDAEEEATGGRGRRERRRKDKAKGGKDAKDSKDSKDSKDKSEKKEPERRDEPVALRGSTRLAAKRRRRQERSRNGQPAFTEADEAAAHAKHRDVERTIVVRDKERDGEGTLTQVGILEDGRLVEHVVTSEGQASLIGNVYLGRVQNVLRSMEAAFIDIGKGRNGVLYASDVDWKAAGLDGRSRRIEQAFKNGDQALVQVTKNPSGHKGARLTGHVSLAGRFLVYTPGGSTAGVSHKLPAGERNRLKKVVKGLVPEGDGAIVRTAAEGVDEQEIGADIQRITRLWDDIERRAKKERSSKGAKPVALYEEPDLLVKVVRDLFNESVDRLVVDGRRSWNTVNAYVQSVAGSLSDRLERYDRGAHGGRDAFEELNIDEQIEEALQRVVYLPSGGSLVIDRTEAMTVIDVNTGRFTGSGGNLEETVTRNNLEAAEEIVRQLRLRDVGGMVVIDFIDMVLEENQDLVLRRLNEELELDRTRHQVSEVTSLGLVQLTRKKISTGLLETFSKPCEACEGRGLVLFDEPVDSEQTEAYLEAERRRRGDEDDVVDAADEAADAREDVDAGAPDRDAEEATGGRAEDEGRDAERLAGRGRRSGRRRGRGRGGSSRGRSSEELADLVLGSSEGGEDAADDLESIISGAIDLADSLDPEEPSGRSYVPEDDRGPAADDDEPAVEERPAPRDDADTVDAEGGEDEYRRAVEEFESSPRRRRRTRGRSRSDRRPRRSDFRAAGEPDRPAEKPAEAREDEASEGGDAAPDRPARKRERPRRGGGSPVAGASSRRRRRVRRSGGQAAAGRSAGTEEPRRDAEPEPRRRSSGSSGRRRRRARRAGATRR